MLGAIALLLICQLAGEAIHRVVGVPLPGPVIGMVLLIVWLGCVRRERPGLEAVSGWLAAHLSIMFVPSAVGLIDQGAILKEYGIGLLVAVTLSTFLTMIVTVLVFRWALRFAKDEAGDAGL